MTKIIIVAGGLATRLGSLSKKIPKCLIDINGTPLIEHQIKHFKNNNYNGIIFCIAHLGDKVKDHFADGKNFDVKIEYVSEGNNLLGTAGSVKLAEELIHDSSFIVYYGDNLTSINLDNVLNFHESHTGLASICMRPAPKGYKGSSIITLDGDKINTFVEKPTISEREKYDDKNQFINSGIYIFNREVFNLIPNGIKYDFSSDLFPKLLLNNSLYGYPTNEFYREIGREEKYLSILEEFKGVKEIL